MTPKRFSLTAKFLALSVVFLSPIATPMFYMLKEKQIRCWTDPIPTHRSLSFLFQSNLTRLESILLKRTHEHGPYARSESGE